MRVKQGFIRSLIIAALVATCVGGCVIKSDVVPAGDGQFLVTGRTGDFGPDVQMSLLKKANAYCSAHGGTVHISGQSDDYKPLQVFGPRTGRLYFTCV
jgi:hypothetical protein